MSSSNLFSANAFLTLSFGAPGVLFPAFVFGQFGLTDLEGTTLSLIRGYAASCLGYGLAMLMLGKVVSAERGLLISSLVFNGTETMLQLHAVLVVDGFNSMIWTTLLSHAVLAVWSLKNVLMIHPDKTNND